MSQRGGGGGQKRARKVSLIIRMALQLKFVVTSITVSHLGMKENGKAFAL